ncbi:MAG TPA: YaiO family outer membrane beta-barrel protein [Candidatus Acidoferrales bacterium]|nr:YaiO family outer membrane beta-barrel protein [Candidatus Acidoferrales bacterium]
MKTMSRYAARRYTTLVGLLFVICVSAPASSAQQAGALADPQQSSSQQSAVHESVESPIRLLTNFVEAGGSYEQLSNGYGRWSGGYFRAVVSAGKNTLTAELNGQHEFGDAGTYVDAGDTFNFSDAWYGSVTMGSSVGGVFWPRSRLDSFLNRKWLGRRQFITTFGYGYDHAKDVHSDHSYFVGTTYYFNAPWILEDGIRFNVSNPGTVFSPSAFVAVTQGTDKKYYVTLNAEVGQEAYQVVGATSVLTRFPSQTATLTWRQWVGRSWGFNLIADVYHSPYYHRGGGSLGFFKDF